MFSRQPLITPIAPVAATYEPKINTKMDQLPNWTKRIEVAQSIIPTGNITKKNLHSLSCFFEYLLEQALF
jgi:hypothetical protein